MFAKIDVFEKNNELQRYLSITSENPEIAFVVPSSFLQTHETFVDLALISMDHFYQPTVGFPWSNHNPNDTVHKGNPAKYLGCIKSSKWCTPRQSNGLPLKAMMVGNGILSFWVPVGFQGVNSLLVFGNVTGSPDFWTVVCIYIYTSIYQIIMIWFRILNNPGLFHCSYVQKRPPLLEQKVSPAERPTLQARILEAPQSPQKRHSFPSGLQRI